VARRKYRPSPAISTAGQSERPRDPAGDESLHQPIEPKPEYGKPPPESAPQSFSTGLKDQLAQQRQYADRPQPQPQQHLDPLASYLISIPGLTIPKFQFLSRYFGQRPHLLNADHWQLLKAAHDITTKEREIPEDSAEYFQSLHGILQQHAPPPAAPPMPPPVHEPAPQPMTHVDVETHDSEPESPMPQHFSAPVSRSDHATAVEPEPTMGMIRLTAEQRDIAARSGISDVEYGKQLLRMQKMKSSGLIK
jgi:hypothetical protein